MIERGLSHIPQPTQGPEQAVTHQAHKKSFGPTTPFSPEQRKLEPAKRTSESPFVLHVTEAVEDVPFAFAKRKGEDDKPNSVAHFYTIQENGKDGRKLHVMVVEYGLDKPADQNKPDEPILIRIDHACTCMRHPIYGHDCNQQREIGEQTMREMGRGMMVYVDTDTVESMGHGPGVLWRHQKRLMEAQQAGEQGPSMLDHFKEEGIT
ncbi:MAG TPA: hypothetical protein VLF93_06970, partial [Candidatus Saccharimonadales bacterium]|nr:hypothetical protein [Candidatus Saccharimonadales bacterium]